MIPAQILGILTYSFVNAAHGRRLPPLSLPNSAGYVFIGVTIRMPKQITMTPELGNTKIPDVEIHLIEFKTRGSISSAC